MIRQGLLPPSGTSGKPRAADQRFYFNCLCSTANAQNYRFPRPSLHLCSFALWSRLLADFARPRFLGNSKHYFHSLLELCQQSDYCLASSSSSITSIAMDSTPQTVAQAVQAATAAQQAAQQQQSPPVQASSAPTSTVDNLTCQWQGCGERCDTAEALYVSRCEVVAKPSSLGVLLTSTRANRTTYANDMSVARAPTTSTLPASGARAARLLSSAIISLLTFACMCR